jgi:hypothetical protein
LAEASAFHCVNDHDKEANENKADIDAYRYMLKQKVYDAGRRPSRKNI